MLEAIKEYNSNFMDLMENSSEAQFSLEVRNRQFRLLDRVNSEYYFFSYPLSDSMPLEVIDSSLFNFVQVSFFVNDRQDYQL